MSVSVAFFLSAHLFLQLSFFLTLFSSSSPSLYHPPPPTSPAPVPLPSFVSFALIQPSWLTGHNKTITYSFFLLFFSSFLSFFFTLFFLSPSFLLSRSVSDSSLLVLRSLFVCFFPLLLSRSSFPSTVCAYFLLLLFWYCISQQRCQTLASYTLFHASFCEERSPSNTQSLK